MNSKSETKHIGNGMDTKAEHSGFSATHMLHDLKDKAQNFGEIAKNKAQNFQEKAIHFQEEATNYVKENYAKIKDTSSDIEDKVTTYAKKNPLKTIGFAMLAGAILSRIFRGRD